ncbi:MAG: hypothetical protein ACPH2K_01835 [Flavicella sp.]
MIDKIVVIAAALLLYSCTDDEMNVSYELDPALETRIADGNFKNVIRSGDLDIDTSKDGIITIDEVYAYSGNLSLDSLGISNLKGIELFSNVKSITCNFNALKTIDVSENHSLLRLECAQNQLEELDVTNNLALTHLLCGQNQLETLDLSRNDALFYVECHSNQLTDLSLGAYKMNVLTCSDNKLTSLDLSPGFRLSSLYCENNLLTSLDFSNNKRVTYLHAEGNPDLYCVKVEDETEQAIATWKYDAHTSISESCE